MQNKILKAISILPAVFLYSLLIYGIVLSIVQAFGFYDAINLNEFTLKYILEVINDKRILSSIIISLIISLLQAILSTLIGILVSIYLADKDIRHKKLLYIPIAIPHIIVGMMFILMFSQNGYLSRLLFHLGIISSYSEFPSIINGKFNIGIILAYIYKSFPYILSVIYISIKSNYSKYYEVAKTMGISKFKLAKDVLLPISKDSILSCFLIIFSYSFGSYELPFLLGNTKNKLISVIAYEKYLSPSFDMRPIYLSINLVMLLIGVLVIILYKRILDRLDRNIV